MLDEKVLKSRARWGIIWMLLRTVVLQLIVLGGSNLVLMRILDKVHFGLFNMAQFAIAFFHFFGDAGLGAALIQKKSEPTQRELSSVFVVQLGIGLTVVALIWIGAPAYRWIWQDLPEGSEWFFRALSLGLLLTMLRVIPQLLMDRQLLFGKLSILDVVGTLSFYGGAVVAALLGLKVWALILGTLLQGLLTTALAWWFRPWKPSLAFDWQAVKPLLRFGVQFQAKTVVAFVNGAITPLYAGKMLGAGALGMIGWAQTTAYFPLKLVDIMGRVTFPLYSRLRDQPKVFAETLGRSIHICVFGTLFFVAFFLSMGEPLIVVVIHEKWLPALPLLHIFAGAISVGFLSPVAASALDAVGRPGTIAKLSVVWTLLNWLVVTLVTPHWRLLGFVAGYSVHIVVGNVALMIILIQVIPGIRLWRRVWAPLLAATAVFFLGRFLAPAIDNLWAFVGSTALCFVTYLALVTLLDFRGVRDCISLIPSKTSSTPTSSTPGSPASSAPASSGPANGVDPGCDSSDRPDAPNDAGVLPQAP